MRETGCNQSGCTEPGEYRFTWPGKDEALICEAHVGKLRNVAAAIGLHLQVVPLVPRISFAPETDDGHFDE